MSDDFDGLTDKHARAMSARELYDRGIIGVFGGGGGGGGGSGVVYGGGSGAAYGSGYVTIPYSTNRTNRLIPDLAYLQTISTPEERQEMNWTNPEAADIAREILNNEKREGLRETVTAAVALYREMLADAHCGSVYSFMKENEDGKHYWYAAIKNSGKWYTTAQNPRVIEGDDEFITWLISLGAHESQAAELTVGAANYAHELGPIDTTSTDS